MLDQTLAAFLQGPVMMILGTRDARGLPAVARVVGARVSADLALVDLFVPTLQWNSAVEALGPGDPVALTFCQPADYRAYQLKGPVRSLALAGEADLAASQTYAAMMRRVLVELGVQPAQTPFWLTSEALVRITFAPDAAFTPTPGPSAGSATGSAA